MLKKKIDAHFIATMGLLIGLMVVLSQVLGFETQLLKITFDFIPEVVMASLFGPFWTAVGAAVADIIGNTLLGKAPFFIGFTLNSFIAGGIYGYFFYKKPITIKNAFLCVLCNTLLISLCLTPIWLSMMYKIPLTDAKLWSIRLLKAVIMLPVQTGLIVFFGNALPFKRLAKNLV
ncbi:folate ECF transporter [Enterococcus saigonensis]|uniref:Folate ECF transporter n=1 Tax=Enterococcus saigonensis TaxID=1805431 RepID=A0A679I819_9ENTE|nr:folate family ECF transporter S component [Enterococcus saigonensis]BCA84580.1 folate ECF transporter [Enterococcus saigonensis]